MIIDAFINDYSLDDPGSEAALENLLEAYRKGSYELVERYGKKLVNAMIARIERAYEMKDGLSQSNADMDDES